MSFNFLFIIRDNSDGTPPLVEKYQIEDADYLSVLAIIKGKPKQIKVSVQGYTFLNIRLGPSIDTKICGSAMGGSTWNVNDLKQDNEGNTWLSISEPGTGQMFGWICSIYHEVERVIWL